MVEINSSRELVDFEPDHLGTRVMSEMSLFTVGAPRDTRSLSLTVYNFDSFNS